VAGANGHNVKNILTLSDPSKSPYKTGKVEHIRWKSSEGLEIAGYIVYPTDFDPKRKYPMFVFIHGGPIGGLGDTGPAVVLGPYEMHYWAARGYVFFAPDYRQSLHYGREQLLYRRERHDLWEQDFADIMNGVDAVVARGFVDESRMAVSGTSWGSFEVNWIITHSNRFAAAVSNEGGDPFMNWGGMAGAKAADVLYYDGTPLDDLASYLKQSPVFYAANVKTPTLLVNSEYGINSPAHPWLYAALRAQGTDARFVYYREDYHGLANPENQRHLMQQITDWVDTHLRASGASLSR
jgi:dipeptidyl aminopeptidase/acylaminoacyl peptidase